MKTGDILLVSGHTTQAKLIQKFQALEHKESAKWNHSGIIYIAPSGVYVIEASYIQQRRFKAAIVFTKYDKYINGAYETKLLSFKFQQPHLTNLLEQELFHYTGTPYGYYHLTVLQGLWKVFRKWFGKKTNTDKRFICHEFTMTIWNKIAGCFPQAYKGNVKDICNSFYFE